MVKRRLFSQIFLSVLIVFTLFAVFSCSMFDLDSSTSSVSFSFSGEFIRNIKSGVSSRSADNEINTENLYAEISLLGSYTDTKTAVLSEGTTITFQEIPVDSKIYAKAEIYRFEDAEKTILYEGESEKITVKDGENTLVLKMKRATPDGTGITALPTTAGKYYLTQDITISSTWTVPSGETVLDLNGYGILMTGSSSVIKVSSGAEFTLTDSGTTTHYFDLSSATTEHGAVTDAYATNITTSSGTQSFTGGYISGGTGTTGSGIYVNGGTFNMYGGTIIGNHVDYSGGSGGGVHVCNGGNFTLYDGTISYNFVQNVCGGVFVTGGTFTMLGGSVSLNKSAWGMGSGIAIRASSTFKLYGGRVEYNEGAINSVPCVDFDGDGITLYLHGNPLVLNNTTTDGTKNIYLREEDNRPTIIIDGELTGNEKTIGMSMKNAGVFTDSTNTSYNDESKFVSDDESYIVSQNSEGQLELTN